MIPGCKVWIILENGTMINTHLPHEMIDNMLKNKTFQPGALVVAQKINGEEIHSPIINIIAEVILEGFDFYRDAPLPPEMRKRVIGRKRERNN